MSGLVHHFLIEILQFDLYALPFVGLSIERDEKMDDVNVVFCGFLCGQVAGAVADDCKFRIHGNPPLLLLIILPLS